ncbi:MAG: MBL fold metallo-hydrolase [Deltaproteobacteria bacterium]|nr:MAG: MBL fold metallo-hydrolase [Deltaproteobacteria bacterium]
MEGSVRLRRLVHGVGAVHPARRIERCPLHRPHRGRGSGAPPCVRPDRGEGAADVAPALAPRRRAPGDGALAARRNGRARGAAARDPPPPGRRGRKARAFPGDDAEMRVTALGSGDAFCSGGRGHTCWLIDDERGTFTVDFGATALGALKRLGRDPDGIGAVHFTHLHGDHIGGWPFLLVDAVYRSRRRSPLVVSGPPGTKDRLQALWVACYAAAAERPLPFAVEVRELEPGDRVELAGRSVLAFRARHMSPPQIALSLRIGDLAFTGDTAEIAEGLCDGATLLCAECTNLGESTAEHIGWQTLRENLPAVPRVLLGHLGADARRGIAPPAGVRVCDDLDFVEL